MDILILASMVLLIILGLVLGLRGYKLIESFMRIFGGIVLGFTFLLIGLLIGYHLGGIWAIVLGPALGIIGLIIGIIFAPKIFWMILALVVFALCFGLGWRIGENLELDGMVVWGIALVAGLVGSWLFGLLARKVLVAATSLIGGMMVAVGTFAILIEEFDIIVAGGIAVGCLVVVAVLGYVMQRGKKGKNG